jgi:hypothetical protein
MSILDRNRRKVQNLTGLEIWFFIVSRVLVGFGLGVFAMKYVPDFAQPIAIPAIVIGVILFIFSARGLRRKEGASGDPQI